MSNGFIRLCSTVFCWAAISACHALLSSHMTNKDDDDMGSHSVTCHPAEMTFPPLPQPIRAGTRSSEPGGMQG